MTTTTERLKRRTVILAASAGVLAGIPAATTMYTWQHHHIAAFAVISVQVILLGAAMRSLLQLKRHKNSIDPEHAETL